MIIVAFTTIVLIITVELVGDDLSIGFLTVSNIKFLLSQIISLVLIRH